MTFIVHRVAGELSITIPTNSYYYDIPGNYNDADDFPTLTFYEGDQSILHLSAPYNSTIDGNAQIVTSSLITRFVFTSN